MEEKRTLEEIEAEIQEVKNELENVKGEVTEVYARIVGYYRSVRNWNKGKKEEFNIRKTFEIPEKSPAKSEEEKLVQNEASECLRETPVFARYEIYTRKTCPNCPPVKNFMQDVDLESVSIDVDTDEGLRMAAEKGVFAAPTVIFFDENGNEAGRAHSVEELSMIKEINKMVV